MIIWLYQHNKRKKQGTHSNINPAVCSILRMRTAISPGQDRDSAAMHSCFVFVCRTHQHGIAVGQRQDSKALCMHAPTVEADAKHPFKRQLHSTHVVAVGWGQHGWWSHVWLYWKGVTDSVWEFASLFFPDASRISAMIGDFPDISAKSGTVGNSKISDRLRFSRYMKTKL